MFNVNYDFQPGDTMFVVLDNTRVEVGVCLDVTFKVYELNDGTITTVITYSVLLNDDGEGTVEVDSTNAFTNLPDAIKSIQNFLTPTPTATVTPTFTPTATVTPTISTTPDITPTNTATPTVTPTNTATPTITPTISVTPSVTPTLTPTPTISPTIQQLLVLNNDLNVSRHNVIPPNVLSTGTLINSSDFNALSDVSSLFVDQSGSRLYLFDNNISSVFRYNLNNVWDITSAVFVESTAFLNLVETDINGIALSPDGLNLYLVRTTGEDQVLQYQLMTPWDLSSPMFVGSLTIAGFNPIPDSIVFGDSGNKMYITENNGLEIRQYDLSTPYYILNAQFSKSLHVSFASEKVNKVQFSSNGEQAFVLSDGFIRTYDLNVAWEIDSAVLQGAGGTYDLDVTNPIDFILESF